MGCDIHFRVEYFAAEETVVVDDGNLAVVPVNEGRWHPAETLTQNIWLTRMREQLASGKLSQESYERYAEGEAELTLNQEDRFYTGRNYQLFWKLTGTRGHAEGVTPIPVAKGWTTMESIQRDYGYGRGLPDDLSAEVADEFEDDLDLHTKSWYSLTELLEVDWSDMDPRHGYSHFDDTIIQMQAVAIEKCDGDTDRVRAVFCYDN